MSTLQTRRMESRIVGKSVACLWLGFTLIVMLTVIAIIAIIAAIIFPVFEKVREDGRRTTAVSQLNQIQNKLALYYLDHNHKYPPVLFAYAQSGISMANIKSVGSAEAWATSHPGQLYPLQGLYPNYINDASVFIDPNNKVKDPSSTDTKTVAVNQLTAGNLAPMTPSPMFYTGDAYDIGPHITGPSSTDSNYVARYQQAWTSTPMPSGFAPAEAFPRQLDQATNTNDTYITMTTYHVPNDKVVVLFLSGSAKVFDPSKVFGPGCGPDSTDISATGGVAQAGFWHIKPSGTCQ